MTVVKPINSAVHEHLIYSFERSSGHLVEQQQKQVAEYADIYAARDWSQTKTNSRSACPIRHPDRPLPVSKRDEEEEEEEEEEEVRNMLWTRITVPPSSSCVLQV